MAKYVLTVKAVHDLDDIWNYTLAHWSEEQADSYYQLLIQSFGIISENPSYGRSAENIVKGHKKFKVERHIIFFRILSPAFIEITRVLHERMDFEGHFR